MTFQALPRHTSLFLIGDLIEAGSGRLRKTVVVSLLLHLCLLSVIMGAKLFKKTERPMSAVEVSLVSLPAVEAKPEPKVEKVESSLLQFPFLPSRYKRRHHRFRLLQP